jgi:hypothetical protein
LVIGLARTSTLEQVAGLDAEVSAADEAISEQVEKAEQAHKDYIRASKEYLAIAFKKSFLEC